MLATGRLVNVAQENEYGSIADRAFADQVAAEAEQTPLLTVGAVLATILVLVFCALQARTSYRVKRFRDFS